MKNGILNLHFQIEISQIFLKCFIWLNSLYSGGPVIKRNWDNGAEVVVGLYMCILFTQAARDFLLEIFLGCCRIKHMCGCL